MSLIPGHFKVNCLTSASCIEPDQSGGRRSEILFWNIKHGVPSLACSIPLIRTNTGNGSYFPLEDGLGGDIQLTGPTVSNTFDPECSASTRYSAGHPSIAQIIRKAVRWDALKGIEFPAAQDYILLSLQQWPEGEKITSYAEFIGTDGKTVACTELDEARLCRHGVCAQSLITFKKKGQSGILEYTSQEPSRSDSRKSTSLSSLLHGVRR